MYLIFDTETTGLPKRWDAPVSDTDNWPRCVQIAWQLHDEMGGLIEQFDTLVRPEGFNIPYDSEQIHGISTDLALREGKPLEEVLKAFEETLGKTRFLVGQNVGFDINVMGAEFLRVLGQNPLEAYPVLDTCTEETAELCRLPGGRGGKFKLPTLTELHQHLFGEPFEEAHNASADVEATTRCFLELIRLNSFKPDELGVTPDYFNRFREANQEPIALLGLQHQNLKKASEALAAKKSEPDTGLSRAEIAETSPKLMARIDSGHLRRSPLLSMAEMSSLLSAKMVQVNRHS